MRRSFSRSWLGLFCLALLASGCSDPFAPPTRVKSAPKADESSGSKPNFLVFVTPGPPSGDVEVWALRGQHEANDKRAVFRIMGPSAAEGPALQPEIVRKAMAEGASALIVYPGDSPELPKALAEAEAKGVPVVLIDKAVAAPEGSKPFTLVEPEPFDATAKKIVAATIEDLEKAFKPVNGTALLLVDTRLVDTTTGRRVAALKSAAEATKFRQVVTVPFDGTLLDGARLAVLGAIKANPDTSVVLTEDGEGLEGAARARSEVKGQPVFFVGGYTDYRMSRVITPPFRESCYVEGRFVELGAHAVLTALARLRGVAVGEHAYLGSKFTKAEGAISSEAQPNSSFPEVKRRDANVGFDEKTGTFPKNDAPKGETPKGEAPKGEAPKP
jgi:ABC-type sugar transport system substrate-binding protein